jgi:hypothetical protein
MQALVRGIAPGGGDQASIQGAVTKEWVLFCWVQHHTRLVCITLRPLLAALLPQLALPLSSFRLSCHAVVFLCPQERMLKSCPPVVVATPGRLWDLITHGAAHLSHLDDLSFFVLDEADRMVQQVCFVGGGGWCGQRGGGGKC